MFLQPKNRWCWILIVCLLGGLACGGEVAVAPGATNTPFIITATPAATTASAVPTKSAPTTVPTTVPAVAAATATATIDANKPGVISGRVYLVAPPTPHMVVYAMDPKTGTWAYVETMPTDGEASYSIEVQPGDYLVFAFSDNGAYVGYASEDGTDLGIVTVAAGQTVADIIVRPPSQSDCGSMFGVPPAPDGRFPGVTVSKDCLATMVARQPYKPVDLSVCQMLQEIASQAITTTFVLTPSAPFSDYASGEQGKGCLLVAKGTGANFSNPGKVVINLVNAFAGWEEQPAYQAGGPTGIATGMKRDMALMLISAMWRPAPEANCPKDQPIGACELTPEQRLYTIKIQIAQK